MKSKEIEMNIPQNPLPSIKNLEEKQKILKDRLLLIGENLIHFREKTEEEMIFLKKELEKLKDGFEKIKNFMENLSGEISEFARKEDLEILKKQAKMFQPLEFVKKSDLEKLKKK